MKKRLLSALLSLVLLLALVPNVAYAMSFPDVPKDSDYATAIEYVSELGVMVGSSNGNFNPNQIVSRCEMATIICRMLGTAENLPKSEVFTDVPTTHWANAYVGKVAELGIVGGYGNGKYGPGDPVTYEQAITMIVRTIGEGDRANSNGGYPKGFIQVAQEKNLLNGIQEVQGQGLSRGAVAMLLYNYYTTQNNSGTSSNPGEHTHNWVTKEGTGHMEQVQVGTKQVLVRNETRQYYECLGCGAHHYSYEEHAAHIDPSSPSFSPNCAFARTLIRTESVPVYEEQPVYENRWVEDTPATTVCSICGATK